MTGQVALQLPVLITALDCPHWDVESLVIVLRRNTAKSQDGQLAMENPGVPTLLWNELDGGLWHATDNVGLQGITRLSEIHNSAANGYENSFCRQLGAISLFDFGPSAVNDWNQFNNWHGWFGYQQNARVAVWLEINRDEVQHRLMDAGSAYVAWKENRPRQFVPGVEACHTGSVPARAISRIVLIDRYDLCVFKVIGSSWSERLLEVDEFAASLPPAPEGGIAEKLRAARLKKQQRLS